MVWANPKLQLSLPQVSANALHDLVDPDAVHYAIQDCMHASKM